jgi:heme/copper-type cytochrome/quinol oxidase subunit 2
MSIHLADAIFWVAVACCSVAQLAILHSVVISPARMATRETSPARRTAEIAWAVLPGIALAFVFAATWRAMHPAHVVASVASLLSAALP